MRIWLLFLLGLTALSINGQTVSGVVTDTRGDAVVGAEVTLESDGVLDRTVTDERGEFSFSSVKGKLRVSAAGFEPVTKQIDRPPAGPLTIIMQPSSVVGNVSVSVTGSETNQANAAASIAVINIDSLDVTAARTLDDTIRQVPFFQTFRRSSSRTTNPTAQGANLGGVSGSGASRAVVLFDGLSINDTFGGWTYWSRVPLVAVEQIEVMRGGASSYYGSAGLSGAVNIVPLRLRDKKSVLKIETSAATQNTADLSGVLLASRRRWEVDLIADIFKTAGYIPVEESSRGIVDTRANSRHSNIILKLGRRFGETNRAFLRGNLFGERRDNGTSLTNNRTYFRQVAAGADLSEVTIRAFAERQVYDQTFSSVSVMRNSESLTRIQRVPSSAFGASVAWRKVFGPHSVAASGEITNARGFSDEVGFFGGSANSIGRSGGGTRDLSLLVRDAWVIAPKFSLDVSARFDRRSNYDGIVITRTIATDVVTETRFAQRTDFAVSPRVGLVYEVTAGIAIYGSFARSFRSPSLNELYRGFRVGNIVTEANAFLTPERANTFEMGASGEFFKRKLIARSSVYATRVTDPIVSITTATTPTLITRQRRNVGTTTTNGFSFDIESSPRSNVKLNVGYLFVDSKISRFPIAIELVGRTLPQVARHNFTAQLRYELRDRWKLSTQIRASSSQFEDDRNTLRLSASSAVDARVSYQFPYFVEVFAAVENIFGSRYDIALTPVRSVAAPRQLRFGLRFNAFRQ